MAKGISISNSGLDIDQLVTNSMKTYTNKYEQLKKKKTLQEWTKTAYTDMYSSLNKFRNTDLFNFRLQKNLAARKVSSSKDSVVNATAMGGAANMTHSVRVDSLASNAYLQTANGKKVSAYTKPDGTAETSVKLRDLANVDFTGYDPTDPAQADKVALSFKISDGTTEKTVSFTMKQLSDTIADDGSVLSDGLTLNDLASEINKQGLSITAKYDATNDSFSMINSKSGAANQIKITTEVGDAAGQKAGTLLTQLQMGKYEGKNKPTDDVLDIDKLADGIKGTDASALIDGRTYTSDKNTFTLADVVYEFKSVSTDTVTIGVSTDSAELVSTVQKFVDTYNDMLDSINKQTHTARNKNYTPLSDEDKEGMTDKQIEKWEEQAKTGLLYNDSILSSLVSQMRSAVSTPIDGLTGEYNSAASLGIEVAAGSSAYKEYGKLHLDTDTLTKAIEEDPDIVYKIFATTDNTIDQSTGKVDPNKQGFANRLNTVLTTELSNLTTKAGSSESMIDQSYLGQSIDTMETSLAAMLAANQRREEAFYKKYNAMEAAIGSLQSSSSSITSLLG